jgi:hypothetical protein
MTERTEQPPSWRSAGFSVGRSGLRLDPPKNGNTSIFDDQAGPYHQSAIVKRRDSQQLSNDGFLDFEARCSLVSHCGYLHTMLQYRIHWDGRRIHVQRCSRILLKPQLKKNKAPPLPKRQVLLLSFSFEDQVSRGCHGHFAGFSFQVANLCPIVSHHLPNFQSRLYSRLVGL